jgi:hypothetical protein
MTPLSFASDKGHLPVCEFLVRAGAEIGHEDKVQKIYIHPYNDENVKLIYSNNVNFFVY